MKHLTLISIAILFSLTQNVFGQTYMDEIVQQSCECLDKVSDDLTKEQIQMEMGLCMLTAASPHAKKLKKDYGINMDNIVNEGEKLGEIIGLKMAAVCPQSLMKMAALASDEEETSEIELSNYISGTVTEVETGQFVTLAIKGEEGKTSRFLWLEFVESNVELPSKYTDLKDKTVEVEFIKREFFDPRIGEYKSFNIITSLKVN